jgi:hypothetical protein
LGSTGGWCWSSGGRLAVAAALVSPVGLGLHTAVVVDDRDEQLVSPTGQNAWREWLRLSNVFGFADQPMTITALSQLATGSVVTTAPADAHASATEGALDHAWQVLIDASLTDAERTLLRRLADAGVPLPEQGFETENGTPMDLAWPDAKVCVLLDDAVDPVAAPWTVAPNDVDIIARLLGARGDNGQE